MHTSALLRVVHCPASQILEGRIQLAPVQAHSTAEMAYGGLSSAVDIVQELIIL